MLVMVRMLAVQLMVFDYFWPKIGQGLLLTG